MAESLGVVSGGDQQRRGGVRADALLPDQLGGGRGGDPAHPVGDGLGLGVQEQDALGEFTHRHPGDCGQGVVLGLGAYLTWRFVIAAFLILFVLSSYVYFGNQPFWNYVANWSMGEDFIAFGYPMDTIVTEDPGPTPRLFRGHYQRFWPHKAGNFFYLQVRNQK